MTDSPTARALGQIHQRIDSHDHRLKTLEIASARQELAAQHIDERLSDIQSGITWITRLVIGGIIAGVVAFIMAGGLNVAP